MYDSMKHERIAKVNSVMKSRFYLGHDGVNIANFSSRWKTNIAFSERRHEDSLIRFPLYIWIPHFSLYSKG